MQKARILGGLAALIVVLLCAVLLAVWLLVNPSNFKGMIAAAVKESLGRDLQMSGDIKLSVFPTVALAVGPARLGNPPGYGDEPFLSFAHAALRVKLLPLLRRRLEVSRVARTRQARATGWRQVQSRPRMPMRLVGDDLWILCRRSTFAAAG
jgi:uncharacterized protein involved in outer membrane biogenesis